jgi:tRNA nucleotidyltransferase/poly(A) polymerase
VTDAWIVGGSLRDELLGRPVRDVDVAVVGDPARAARALAERVRGPVFRLSGRSGHGG